MKMKPTRFKESKKVIVTADNALNFFQNKNNIGSSIPIEMIKEMFQWDLIWKSPASHSFYSKEKSWAMTHDKTIRLSNHWNFKLWNSIHCKTSTPIENGTHWAFGIYDTETKMYTILSKQKAILDEKEVLENIEKLKELFKEATDNRRKYGIKLQEKVNNGGVKIKVTQGMICDAEGKRSQFIESPIEGVATKIGNTIVLKTETDTVIIKSLRKSKKYKYEILEEIL